MADQKPDASLALRFAKVYHPFMRVLIVGCGYVGVPLGAELVRLGHEVFGLRRSDSAESELKAAGIQPLIGDVTRPETLAALPRNFDWVVNCVAAGGNADNYREIYLQGTRNLIDRLASNPPKKFVYTSSTSVYAQNDGSQVKESSPAEPLAETSKILVATENLLLSVARSTSGFAGLPLNRPPATFSPSGGEGRDEGAVSTEMGKAQGGQLPAFPAVILRVAGIYGPDRGHWFKQFMQELAYLEGDGARWLNMIHRDDLVGCIIAALKNGRAGEIYNAVDDEPVSQLHFFQWLAEAVNKPLPPSVPENPDANRRRGLTNKRVSNRKLKMELGHRFKYPTFREGYSAELLRLDRAGI
ncbi:MAG TPA: SDR family oxidoreductase [Verrucomicrobiae bacterium]|nr:SDR family oxidoreductase [Verrucomicrobiae bacterium]